MKTMKQLLIVIGLVSLLNLLAQDIYAMPEAHMYSTSAMVGCGSSLPQAAVTGTSTTYDQSHTPSGPRRIIDKEDQEDKENDGWKEPGTPLTDAVPCLLLLAVGYALYTRRKNKQDASLQRKQASSLPKKNRTPDSQRKIGPRPPDTGLQITNKLQQLCHPDSFAAATTTSMLGYWPIAQPSSPGVFVSAF